MNLKQRHSHLPVLINAVADREPGAHHILADAVVDAGLDRADRIGELLVGLVRLVDENSQHLLERPTYDFNVDYKAILDATTPSLTKFRNDNSDVVSLHAMLPGLGEKIWDAMTDRAANNLIEHTATMVKVGKRVDEELQRRHGSRRSRRRLPPHIIEHMALSVKHLAMGVPLRMVFMCTFESFIRATRSHFDLVQGECVNAPELLAPLAWINLDVWLERTSQERL